jgi:hypothetical protein
MFSAKKIMMSSSNYHAELNKWTQIGQDIQGFWGEAIMGCSTSLSPDGHRLVIGSPVEDFGRSYSRISSYSWNGNSWVEEGVKDEDYELPSSFPNYNKLGSNIRIYDYGIVSASTKGIELFPNDLSSSSVVNVQIPEEYNFDFPGTGIGVFDMDSKNTYAFATFAGVFVALTSNLFLIRNPEITFQNTDAYRVAVSGGSRPRVATGSYWEMNEPNVIVLSGKVRVYEYNPSGYVQIGQTITPTEEFAEAILEGLTSRAYFPESLCMSENGKIVAIVSKNCLSVWDWNGSSWISRPTFTFDGLGESIGGSFVMTSAKISADGNTLVVGFSALRWSVYNFTISNFESDTVRVYNWNGSSWIQLGQDIKGIKSEYHGIGISISAEGSVIAFGTPLSYTKNNAPHKDESGNSFFTESPIGHVEVHRYKTSMRITSHPSDKSLPKGSNFSLYSLSATAECSDGQNPNLTCRWEYYSDSGSTWIKVYNQDWTLYEGNTLRRTTDFYHPFKNVLYRARFKCVGADELVSQPAKITEID